MTVIAQEEDPTASSRLVASCFVAGKKLLLYSKYGIACQENGKDKYYIAVARMQYKLAHQQQEGSNTLAMVFTVDGTESETSYCERQSRIRQETASCAASILLASASSTCTMQFQPVQAADSYCVICRFHEPEVHVWDRLWGCNPQQERDMLANSDLVTGCIYRVNQSPAVLQENTRFNPTALVFGHHNYECRMLQNSNYIQQQGYNIFTSELVP